MTPFESSDCEKILVRRMNLPDHSYVDFENEVMEAAPASRESHRPQNSETPRTPRCAPHRPPRA
jgi:hypothetical protein